MERAGGQPAQPRRPQPARADCPRRGPGRRGSGYTRLTIPAISAASGTSNQTFYEHFDGKEEAFLAAFDELARRALQSTAAASVGESDWQGAVNAGIRGLLEHLVEEPLFAQIAFFEIPTAGAAALDRADAVVRRFTGFLDPRAVPEGLAPLPPVVVEAIGGGMWGAIQHEIAAGRLSELPDKAPESPPSPWRRSPSAEPQAAIRFASSPPT